MTNLQYWLITIGVCSSQLMLAVLLAINIFKKHDPFFSSWKKLQSELADTLHHPHPKAQEMDRLLEKLEDFTLAGISAITPDERSRLVELLRNRMDDTAESTSERTRAELLLFAMRRVENENKAKPLT